MKMIYDRFCDLCQDYFGSCKAGTQKDCKQYLYRLFRKLEEEKFLLKQKTYKIIVLK